MKTIYFVRHGESQGNRDGLICGTYDSPLTDQGKEQASLLGSSLKNLDIQEIISSDLLRARETVEIVAKHLGLSVIFDKRLRERSCGIFEGKPFSQIKNHKDWVPFISTPKYNVDGGETIEELYARVGGFLKYLVKNTKSDRILLSSHGAVLWILVPFVLGIPIEKYKGKIGMDNCSLSIFSWDGEFALERLNCISHLGEFAKDKPSWRF